ncbi:MAG: dipeptidase [Verrucomicrobiales bacterium]|nr:dipeptidase [Verrucomicrobiales bacterium]
MIDSAVEKYLSANQERFLEELCEYLRFPSVSAQPHHASDMRACADWLAAHCQKMGLEVECCPTAGNPIVLARTPRTKGSRKPHFVVYGHYDVQPPEPLELWQSPPFEPQVDGDRLRARGSSDNKGQHFAHLKAVEAYLRTGKELPCDLTFLVEGEEEVGCTHLGDFLRRRRRDLRCEAIVISDTGMPSPKHPALTYALRGIAAMEVVVTGPDRDLHSGIFGGSVDNPAMVLCELMAHLRDAKGRITVPGFYEGVRNLKGFEREQIARLPFTESKEARFLGVKQMRGEQGFSFLEQRSARPTCEINGLTSGYQGEGSKTIIPSWARAKLTFRLVPDQSPDQVIRRVTAHLKKVCPPTVRLEVIPGHGGAPYLLDPRGPLAQASLRALRESFRCEPILLREGGSIPIVNEFKRLLGVDSLLLGLALPDANAHSPNETMSLNLFRKGMRMAAVLWPELAAAAQK